MKVKLIQFNIRTGFRIAEKPYSFEESRINFAKKIIKKENPDILLLNEAYFESKNKSKILMDYQKIFNFPFYAHGNYKRGLSPFWGHAVLSKYPIIKQINKSNDLSGLLKIKIKVNKKIVNIDFVHLSPTPLLKNKGQRDFIKKVLNEKKENYILSGDFNSLSPDDNYNKKRLISSWSKFEKDAKNVVNEMLKRDAIKYILSKGFIDSYKAKNKKFKFTIPTDFLSKDKSSGIRIDYIFCSPDIKIKNAGIIKSKEAEKASDHYPIYAELEM